MSDQLVGLQKWELPRNILWRIAVGAVAVLAQIQSAIAGGGNMGTFGMSSTGYSVTRYGSISSGQDVWTFTVTGKATGVVYLSSLTADLDLKLSNGQISQKSGTATETISFNLDPGTYSLTVYPYNGARSGYSLRLGFTVAAPSVSELNFNGGTNPRGFFTQTIGTPSTGTTHWVVFNITGRYSVPIRLSGMAIDLDMDLRKGSKSGPVIARSTNGGTTTENIVTTLDPGQYYLRIYRYGSSGSTTYRTEIQTGGTIRW